MCVGSTTGGQGGYVKTQNGVNPYAPITPVPPPQTAVDLMDPEARRRLAGKPSQLEQQRQPLVNRIGL